jgi:hypothetical protein
MQFSTTDPWWMTDTYDEDSPVLTDLYDVATVSVNRDGSTQPGWGLDGKLDKETGVRAPGFMENFLAGKFNNRVTAFAYRKRQAPFAFVMRSVPFICIDVDGKNGGFENMPQLGELPPTLAETSKSGNGYHLFYFVDEPWDDVTGYGRYDDVIGIATGIDIRATGCVYHYPTQRWNNRGIAPLPDFLADRLREKKERRDQNRSVAASVKEMDVDDILVLQHNTEAELAKPIPAGQRNNRLFAIGSQMKAAEVQGWEDKVYDRAIAVGLDVSEAEKLVSNIAAYSG